MLILVIKLFAHLFMIDFALGLRPSWISLLILLPFMVYGYLDPSLIFRDYRVWLFFELICILARIVASIQFFFLVGPEYRSTITIYCDISELRGF